MIVDFFYKKKMNNTYHNLKKNDFTWSVIDGKLLISDELSLKGEMNLDGSKEMMSSPDPSKWWCEVKIIYDSGLLYKKWDVQVKKLPLSGFIIQIEEIKLIITINEEKFKVSYGIVPVLGYLGIRFYLPSLK